jgi:hypothetical protein
MEGVVRAVAELGGTELYEEIVGLGEMTVKCEI